MKVLSKEEMKKVMGGNMDDQDESDEGDSCPTNCDSKCSSGANCRCCHGGTKYAYCIDASNSCSS